SARANPGVLALQAGLSALATLPLVLVAFTYAVQPVLVDRYGLPAVAALAPLVALVATSLGRGCGIVLCGALILLGGREMGNLAADYRQRDEAIDAHGSLISSHRNDEPVL